MVTVFIYLLAGLFVTYLVSVMHLIIAEENGYAALKYWSNPRTLKAMYARKNIPAIITGLFIWPVRIIQFIRKIKTYYTLYELK